MSTATGSDGEGVKFDGTSKDESTRKPQAESRQDKTRQGQTGKWMGNGSHKNDR